MAVFVNILCSGYSYAEDIVINEVGANPKGSESGAGSPGDRNEFFELLNLSRFPVDLSGLFVTDGDQTDVIIAWTDDRLLAQNVLWRTTVLLPGQYAVVLDPEYVDSGDFYQPYTFGDSSLIVTVGNTTLGNGLSTTDPLILLDSFQNTISSYGTPMDSMDSIPFDPGDGISVERLNPYLEDLEKNWFPSKDSCTPGMDNSVLCGNLGIDPSQMKFSEAKPGEACTVSVVFENFGPETLGNFLLRGLSTERLSGQDSLNPVFEYFYVESLHPGEHDSLSSVWNPAPPGLYNFWVKALEASASRLVRFGELPGQIVLSELMFAPDVSGEWFEIRNRSYDYCSLEVRIFSGTETTSAQISASAKSFVVLCEDSAAFRSEHGSFDGELLQLDNWPTLGNSEDSLSIEDFYGTVIDNLLYAFSSWENGFSLERVCDDVSSSQQSNWLKCVSPERSTPGEVNSVQSILPQITGNASVSPNPFSPDGDGFDETCVIGISLGTYPERIKVKIYDIRGFVLREFESFEPGLEQYFIWDGRDKNGQISPPGIYLIFISSDLIEGNSFSRKLTVVLAEKL
ncbi:lamin tail domain-containing protein [candidate division WOR-3 bacterium]|nr:lamin tail domain-containing protein [candidate division WOR-3 bacterium]